MLEVNKSQIGGLDTSNSFTGKKRGGARGGGIGQARPRSAHRRRRVLKRMVFTGDNLQYLTLLVRATR